MTFWNDAKKQLGRKFVLKDFHKVLPVARSGSVYGSKGSDARLDRDAVTSKITHKMSKLNLQL